MRDTIECRLTSVDNAVIAEDFLQAEILDALPLISVKAKCRLRLTPQNKFQSGTICLKKSFKNQLNREGLAIEVDFNLPAPRVVSTLDRMPLCAAIRAS